MFPDFRVSVAFVASGLGGHVALLDIPQNAILASEAPTLYLT